MNYTNKLNLNKKIAFVVGGGLIGKEVVNAFLDNGAKVVLLDIENNFQYKKKNIYFEKFDISKLSLIEDKLKKITKKHGLPNIFVNCSYPRTKDWKRNSFSKINLDSFRKNIDIHLNSFSWMSKLIADTMSRSKNGGSIINLGSIYGIVGQDLNTYLGTDMKESMTYSIIKGGLTNLSRQMASYYGKYNIRINTVCPGGVEDSKQSSTFKKNYSKKTPLKRLAKSHEVASAILFLSSDASSYITGTSLIVDGGWTAI